MLISAAFPPVPETPGHIALAERLGFHTAFVYDTPALQLDVWMTLAMAAERTSSIRLGPGVLIPSLRHPMVTAAAIATLVGLVGPDRVVVGAGTGRAMGQKPLRWADFPAMVGDVQALLRGEEVLVDGQLTQMLHGAGQAVERPIEVPWILGVNGPRGHAAAREMGCGVFTSRPRPDADFAGLGDVVLLAMGTVLDDGEDLTSPRVLETAGPGVVVGYHALLEQRDARLDVLPNSARFVELVEDIDAERRHLALHEGHLTVMNDIDREIITPEALGSSVFTCRPEEVPGRMHDLGEMGVTEVAFQPMGDVERELEAVAAASGLMPRS